MKEKIIAIVSGGLDSTAMYKLLESQGYEIIPLNFSYGSKHNNRERQSARELFGDKLIEMNIDLSFLQSSSLINRDLEVAKNEYTRDVVEKCVVPFRNGIFLAYATAMAEEKGAKLIALGNHSADHEIYPDCRPEFIEKMSGATSTGTIGNIKIMSPFVNVDKSEIINLVKDIDGIEETLAKTYSCYNGRETHCGECATCLERKRAFKEAGITDKTIYIK